MTQEKPTKEGLRDMRDKGMTLYQISRKYNTTIPIIFQLEIEYGINSWSYNLKYAMTKEDLNSMYVDEGMNQLQIAEELGCSQGHVCDMMNRYHIQARVSGKYTVYQLSLKADNIIQNHKVQEHGIPTRQCIKYTPQQRASKINEIVRLHDDEHMTQEEIAEKVGYSTTHVCKILHGCGVQTRGRGRFTDQQRQLLHDKIEQKYNNGETQEEIAEEFGYTTASVSVILKERGILTRGYNGIINHQKLSSITADKIKECIGKGMSQIQIAEYFNVSDVTIYRLAEKFGIPGMVSNYRCTTPEYLKWRREVLKRDNYTCQLCGKTGVRLEVHHVIRWADAPELRYNVDNGVPLCYECHQKVTGHEYEYAQHFLDITQPQCREHEIIESMPWEPPLELHSIIGYPEEKGVITP